MSFTYAQLKQAIQDYTENDETTFVNNSKEKAELFGVTAEIQQSSK